MAGARNLTTYGWTDARTSKMIALKKKGYSAAQIAKALGATTREAVIGKMDRMGLNRRGEKRHVIDAKGLSANPGVKTRALQFDLSPAELLRPRRFSWEGDSA